MNSTAHILQTFFILNSAALAHKGTKHMEQLLRQGRVRL